MIHLGKMDPRIRGPITKTMITALISIGVPKGTSSFAILVLIENPFHEISLSRTAL
jgi:hypothetical protein